MVFSERVLSIAPKRTRWLISLIMQLVPKCSASVESSALCYQVVSVNIHLHRLLLVD